jgi:shikimate 5-dehydrogenase
MTPPPALAAHHMRTHGHSTVSTLGRNEERSSLAKRAYADRSRHARADPTRTKGTSIISIRSNATPVSCNKDKTTPPSDDGQYGDSPSKYGPMKHMYNSSHRGVGSTMVALT